MEQYLTVNELWDIVAVHKSPKAHSHMFACAKGVFRSCYVCRVTGMELGCFEYETRNVDCGRERDEGPKIYAG